MPRCFPQEPVFRDGGAAESVVWRALCNQLPAEAGLFSSVNLLEAGVEREIDVLVAWPGVGLAAIEVKGGHVTRDAQGWHQESGGQRRDIDPVRQSQDAKKALVRRLDARSTLLRGVRAAHLVALPYVMAPAMWDSAELPRTALLDTADLRDVAGRVRAAVEQHGAGHRGLPDDGVDAVLAALHDQLGGQSSLLSQAKEHELRVDALTREQARVLNGFKYQRRLKVLGGAGTGKTWLALEQARRLAKAGERVALVCYSRGLARFFERVVGQWPARERPAYVGLFHQLPVLWGAEPGREDHADDFEERLPRELGELAARRPVQERFDSVVVDEAQDFGEQWWPSLSACLREPARGGLYVFMDEAQRVFLRAGEAPLDLAAYVLDENIRNTKTIAQLFSSLSGEDLRPRGVTGPKVRLVECAPDDALSVADDAVDALLEEGIEPGDIALLCTHHRHPEQKQVVDLGGWEAYWDDFLARDSVFYGHVLGFKGLERAVVVLVVNGFREDGRSRERLYVGLSRATTLLVVVGQRAELERVGGQGVAMRLRSAQVWVPAG